MNVTAFEIAQRFVGLKEVAGPMSNLPRAAMRLIQRALWRPAVPQALLYCRDAESGPAGPSGDGVGQSIERHMKGGAGIGCLLRTCGPSTILRTVVSVVINALKGMFGGWLRAHVTKERFEGLNPSFADRNSSAAVVGKLRSIWIKATALHCSPGPVLSRQRASVAAIVGGPRFPKASTRNWMASSQDGCTLFGQPSAITPTDPLLLRWIVMIDDELTEALTADVATRSPHLLTISGAMR